MPLSDLYNHPITKGSVVLPFVGRRANVTHQLEILDQVEVTRLTLGIG